MSPAIEHESPENALGEAHDDLLQLAGAYASFVLLPVPGLAV